MHQQDFGTMMVDWEERVDVERLRRERLQKAKDALAASDLDALFAFRYEDARYLTGFRSHLGPTVAFGLVATVLPREGEPILFTMDEEHCRARMPWLEADQIHPRPNLREKPGIQKFVDRLEGILGRKLSGKVGVDLWTPAITSGLQAALGDVEFVDGYRVLMAAKQIKTEDEIVCLKIANAMTEAAMDAAIRFLKPGVRENQVLAVAWQTMTDLGSEWTQCANIVASGPYTAPYRRFTSDRIIRYGDPVVIDIGACYMGYWGDFTRTWICGDVAPTDEQIDLHQQCYDDLFNACTQAAAGNTNADVFRAAEPVDLESLGHSAGVSPWEPPYLSPDSLEAPVTLEPNMVLNIEPYKGTREAGGFRLENDLVVRAEGPEIYTTYRFDQRLLREVHALDTSTGRVPDRPGVGLRKVADER